MASVSSRKVVFFHIPKTAGMSLNAAIEENVDSGLIARQYPPLHSASQYSDLGKREVFVGHICVGEEPPEFSDAFRITFLRDPVSRLRSQLHFDLRYFTRTGSVAKDNIYRTFIEQGNEPVQFIFKSRFWYFDNCMVRVLSGIRDSVPFGEVKWQHFEMALENLRGFGFVGFQEFFAEDMNRLGRVLRWRVDIRHENQAKEPSPVTQAQIGALVDLNYFDSVLYARALRTRIAESVRVPWWRRF